MILKWTAPALADLEALGDYIARFNANAAERVVGEIFDQTERLIIYPNVGRIGRLPNTRELVIGGTPYIVPYRIRGLDIEVLVVFHGARQWPDAFE